MEKYQIQPLKTEIEVTGLVNVSYYKLPKTYRSDGEQHDFWELVYVDKGQLAVITGSDRYLLKTGEIVFHGPNDFHNLQIYNETQANVLVVSFCCDSPAICQLQEKILFLNQAERQCLTDIVREGEGAFAHFDNVAPAVDLRLREQAPFGCLQMVKNALEQLLIRLCRRENSISFDTRILQSNARHHQDTIVSMAKAYVHKHYPEKITLAAVASELNLSATHLNRIFRERTGQSVMTYLGDYRLGEAKRLIQEDSLTFSQIAEAVGYNSIYYFSAVFREKTGMSLTQYAQSVRK